MGKTLFALKHGSRKQETYFALAEEIQARDIHSFIRQLQKKCCGKGVGVSLRKRKFRTLKEGRLNSGPAKRAAEDEAPPGVFAKAGSMS